MRIKNIFKIHVVLLSLLFCINSFAAAVSDNDGSAFITKGEFDSLKNNFQSQIDNFNTNIDSKIDSAISSYLSGIRITAVTEKTPLAISTYGNNPVFHNGDNANRTYADTTNNIAWGAYNLSITQYNLTQRKTAVNGAFMMVCEWVFPSSKFKILHKLKWDNDKEEWLFTNVANDAAVNWKWITSSPNYNMASGANVYVHWAWMGSYYYQNIRTKNGISMGTRGSSYNAWAESSSTSRSYSDVATATQPSWSTGSWNNGLACNAGLWTEIDESDWKDNIEHLWVSDDNNAVERKVDLTSDEIHYLQNESMEVFKAKVTTTNGPVNGAYSDPKYQTSNLTWTDVYSVAIHGWAGNSTYNVLKRKTRLKPSEVKYKITNGLSTPIKLSLYEAPLFDHVEKDTESLQFEITLSNEDGYADANLYFSKKTWSNADHKPADADIVKLYKDDSTTEENYISLTKGKKTKIRIKDLKKDDILYFSLVPPSGSKAKIDELSKCTYNFTS